MDYPNAINTITGSSNHVGQGLDVKRPIIQSVVFAGGTEELALLTPVSFNTNTKLWQVWSHTGSYGANEIKGFVWPETIQLADGEEVFGNVLLGGSLQYTEIELPSGETRKNLIAALSDGPRRLGLCIDGLNQAR